MGGLPFMFGKKKLYGKKKFEIRKILKMGENTGFFEHGLRNGCEWTLYWNRKKVAKCAVLLKRGVILLVLALAINILVWSGQRMLLQRGIADEVLRFHVLANSDSEEDQAVKLEVRDAVLAWLEEAQGERSVTQGKRGTANIGAEESLDELQENQGKGRTLKTFQGNQKEENTLEISSTSDLESEKNRKEKEEEFLRAHLTDLETVANNVLASRGKPYQAHAELTTCYFPSRTYGTCTFPSGWYEALRIKLGKAKGHNWWCVLYPRLCFTDSLHAVVKEEEMQQLSDVLTEAEYDSLLHEPSRWKLTFRWF